MLLSGLWKSPVVFNIAGTEVGLPGIVRDVGLIVVTFASLRSRKAGARITSSTGGPWGGGLFAGIFLTIIPVIAMLKAGVNGPFGAIVAAVTAADGSPDPAAASGPRALSSFLRQRAHLPRCSSTPPVATRRC